VAQNSLAGLPTADELAWRWSCCSTRRPAILHGSVLYLDRAATANSLSGIGRAWFTGPLAAAAV